MFTSSNNNININPFTLLSSSSSCYHPSLYVTDHQNFFFNPAVPVPLSLTTTNPLSINTLQNNAVISKKNVGVFINGDDDQQQQQLQIQKRPVKKHRHSKIRTAQGERDRRVRLSIEISRKFFDLQDMLGFDKASKTLEWLLFKSRKAIKELEKNYEGVLKSFYTNNSTTSCENGENIEELIPKKKDKKVKKVVTNSTKKNVVSSTKVVAKETRAKARERARERTRVKMCHDQLKINQTMVGNYQQNHIVNFNESANLAQNWDINSAIMHSNFCAVTNMNRQSGLQIYGKLW